MKAPHEPADTSGRPSQRARGSSRYLLLFAIQTIGALILIGFSLPLYRQILFDPGSHIVRSENLIWSVSAVVLMQAGFWMRHRLGLAVPSHRNALVGLIIRYVARMAFVLATSIFGFIFIIRRPEFHIPTSRYVVVIVGLFALFCYTQEVDRLGNALIGPEQGAGDSRHK
jgi:hypothetical protein